MDGHSPESRSVHIHKDVQFQSFGPSTFKYLLFLNPKKVKNKILKTLIEEAKNICNIQEAQIKQIIQITEQLTKNNFIVVIFKDNRTSKCMSHTEFKFHPKKTVQEIKKKLFNSNDEMELLLLVRYSSV